eukprot:scaffold1282_cov251-Pinguiococcus_pyrenoidosus.AAC.77
MEISSPCSPWLGDTQTARTPGSSPTPFPFPIQEDFWLCRAHAAPQWPVARSSDCVRTNRNCTQLVKPSRTANLSLVHTALTPCLCALEVVPYQSASVCWPACPGTPESSTSAPGVLPPSASVGASPLSPKASASSRRSSNPSAGVVSDEFSFAASPTSLSSPTRCVPENVVCCGASPSKDAPSRKLSCSIDALADGTTARR